MKGREKNPLPSGRGGVKSETLVPDDVPGTETIDPGLSDLDLRATVDVLAELLASQRRAVEAVEAARAALAGAVEAATGRLADGDGRLVLVGAGASGGSRCRTARSCGRPSAGRGSGCCSRWRAESAP